MATRRFPPKLFVVTLRRSFIGRPWWTRETLKGLGFRKRCQKIICKNTPSVVGQLREVKDMIDVKPVVLRTDINNSPTGKEMLLDNGEFFISPETLEELTNDVKLKLNSSTSRDSEIHRRQQ